MHHVQSPPAPQTERRELPLEVQAELRREERSRRRHHVLMRVLLGIVVVFVVAYVHHETHGSLSLTLATAAAGAVVMVLAIRRRFQPATSPFPAGPPAAPPVTPSAPSREADGGRRHARNDARYGPIGPALLRGPHGVRLVTVTLLAIVALTVVAAVAALLVAVGSSGRPQAGVTAASVDPGPGGFAADCVKLVLRAGEDKRGELSGCYGNALPDLAGVPSGSFDATGATARQVTELGSGYWSVLVAVDQVERITNPNTGKAAWQPVGLHYYKLGVARRDGQLVAVGLPASVAPPPAADPPDLAVATVEESNSADPRTDRLSRFFGAFLAGAGALEDSVLPGKQAAAIDPPPYTTVTLRAVGYDADPAQPATNARVVVAATTDAGNVQVLGYSVRLLRRDGRWYVASLDAAPTLATG